MTAPIPTPQSGAALLEGQVVVCTGAGSGIGRGAVEAFLGHGARVAVLDRDPTKVAALGGLGSQLVALAGDATTAGDNKILVAEALSRWGRVDAAVTFVGVFDFYTSLADIPDDRCASAFDETFALNVASPVRTARAATAAL
ncbi:MAG: SDR family NAD(P)-dependent oxidoreductase, partial [Acidimicrobiales bacterium]